MKNKTILVSGLTSGLGKEFLKIIKNKKNYRLISIGKKKVRNKKIIENIICNFESPSEVDYKMSNFQSKIDIFINFAGVMGNKNLTDEDFFETQKILNVNLFSPLRIISNIYKNFNKDGICLLIGSQSSFRGSFCDTYAITKAGIHGAVISLNKKFGPKIRIVNLAPGIFTGSRMTDKEKKVDLIKKAKTVPMGRLATAREIARICELIISNDLSYITGSTIHVDGGNIAR